jgi:Flp pilus assembly pilin Flp
MKLLQKHLKQFWRNEDGIGTLELLLIIAVIVIIAIAFRKWIMKWVKQMFDGADSEIKTQNMDGSNISPPSAAP